MGNTDKVVPRHSLYPETARLRQESADWGGVSEGGWGEMYYYEEMVINTQKSN